MRQARTFAATALLIILGALACAPQQKAIVARGILDVSHRPQLAPGASICVMRNREAGSSSLHEDLATEAEKLLVDRGFRITPASEAEFLVFFGFGTIQTTRGKIGNEPDAEGFPSGAISDSLNGSYSAALTDPAQSRLAIRGELKKMTPKTTPRPEDQGERFLHYVTVIAIDGREFRQENETLAVWRGDSRLLDTYSKNVRRPRELLDRLFLAVFESFGEGKEWSRWYEDLED